MSPVFFLEVAAMPVTVLFVFRLSTNTVGDFFFFVLRHGRRFFPPLTVTTDTVTFGKKISMIDDRQGPGQRPKAKGQIGD